MIDPERWPSVTKHRNIPYGYMTDPEDNTKCIPNPDIVPFIDEAINALNNGASLRDVADFLNEKVTHRTISHSGLNNIWTKHGRTRVLGKPVPKPKPKSMAERKELRRRFKIAQVKKSLNYKLKKIEKLGGEITSIKEEAKKNEPLRGIVEVNYIPEPEEQHEIIFQPNKGPQTEFLAAEEQEVLYGGAAGGGKSFAMLADPIRYFSNPNFRGLLLRRTNDELKELKWKARDLYDNKLLKGQFNTKDSLWRFPSGAEFWLTYLERDEDVKRYQGQSFTWIGVDELTQYATPFPWIYLSSRLRSTDSSLPLSMRATSNPGGVGHGWVKEMFINPAPANQTFDAKSLETGEVMVHPEKYGPSHPLAGQSNPKAGQPLFQRRFIPARLYDNPYLVLDDKYESSLLALPEAQRRQLLEGDWSVAEGAAFTEFRIPIHVIKPFDIPSSWRRFRSCDYGYSTFSAVHWYAVDPDERLYVYREMYTSKKTGSELGQMILSAEKNEKITYGVLDSSVWAMRGQTGPSIAEEILQTGCRFRPSDSSQGSRIAGKNRLHELLKLDGSGRPGILFFDTCRQIIADLPVIPMDPKGSDDIDDRYQSDHAYDSIRYGIMSRPRSASQWEINPITRTTYSPTDSIFGY